MCLLLFCFPSPHNLLSHSLQSENVWPSNCVLVFLSIILLIAIDRDNIERYIIHFRSIVSSPIAGVLSKYCALYIMWCDFGVRVDEFQRVEFKLSCKLAKSFFLGENDLLVLVSNNQL